MNFPGMIEWMEDYGFEELHRMHKDYQKDMKTDIPFNQFVEDHYECCKEQWADEMCQAKKIQIPYNENNGVDTESAKQVMVGIINNIANNPSEIGEIIDAEDPCALHIVNRFWDTIVPAVEKALKEIKEY